MFKKVNVTKKVLLNAIEGISMEILYALAIMAAAFLVCLIIIY
ncbi:MAG: hypothetical protein PHT53_05785 [Candidatus Omnitrophica bacterium]|nr:hypothetical protein [Candidatus Omnitrophota bacterium]